MDGAHIIAYTPDANDFNADGSFKGIKDEVTLRNPEFTEIAEQSKELLNYPAYHMYDANYGGTVYQMIEYDGKLYMAINAGQKALHSTLNPEYTAVDPDTREETKCYAGYAILEGTLAPAPLPLTAAPGAGSRSSATRRTISGMTRSTAPRSTRPSTPSTSIPTASRLRSAPWRSTTAISTSVTITT